MTGKAVATPVASQVPALAPTPATTITAEDIAIPRIYIGNYMSEAVKHKHVDFGDVFLALGSDDSEPQVLWSLGSDEPGVLFHVLHLRKAKSWSDGGPLELYDFDDPSAPAEAWTTYNYTLFLPEVDPDMPARLLLTKSGRPTAQKINTVLARSAAAGPNWSQSFRLTSVKKKNDKGEYATAEARVAQADPAHVRQAGELFELIAAGLDRQSTTTTVTGDEPAI